MLLAGPQCGGGVAETDNRPNARQELIRVHRFDKVVIRPDFSPIHLVGGADRLAGNQNDKNVQQGRVSLDLPADVNPAQVRQPDIQQHQIRPLFTRYLETPLPVRCLPNFVTGTSQDHRKNFTDGGFIIHNENAGCFIHGVRLPMIH